MPNHSLKTFIIPTMKVDNISISAVLQVGESKAIFPHIDTFAQGAGRGAGSFNTQYFPRSRTRLHYANQTDLETVEDQNIVDPAPDPEQFADIHHMNHVSKGVMQRFYEDGHTFITSTSQPVHISDIRVKSLLGSAVLHIGNTGYASPVIHSISRGLMGGAVAAPGGPVGAIR